MGFFSGRVTALRFRVVNQSFGSFGPDHLANLQQNVIGSQRVANADGIEIGWTAGRHVLDTDFDLARNIVNDTLQFDLRIDQQKFPSDLMKAYTQVELDALAQDNPSGRPSARQRRMARANAQERLEDEGRDGRFIKRRTTPVLWDAVASEVMFGSTSVTALDHFLTLFHKTFGATLEPLTAGRQAFLLAQAREQTRGVDDADPSAFVPGTTPQDIAWNLDESSRDFLGNEFLLWLWYAIDGGTDTFKLVDDSKVAVMLTRTLVLECPRAETGKETISSDDPTRLPEARRAIEAGKWPRRVGMILVRHDQQYDLTLQAETLAITSARLPAPEEVDERARLEERVNQIRHLTETLDLLYDEFNRRRTTDLWSRELARIQKWLHPEGRPRLTAV